MIDFPLSPRQQAIADAAAAADLGTPWARKSGRDQERRPYVPVLVHHDGPRRVEEQIRVRAYLTRAEALESASRTVDRRRATLAARLAQPRHRALREAHGLPRELEDIPD